MAQYEHHATYDVAQWNLQYKVHGSSVHSTYNLSYSISNRTKWAECMHEERTIMWQMVVRYDIM